MFDILLRPLKDKLLDPLAKLLSRIFSANAVTLISLLFGIAAVIAVFYGHIGAGLILWLLNRITDGLDGAVARVTDKSSDLGGYLDIMADFLIYAALPIAFALQSPAEAALTAVAVLLAAFYINAGAWMYLSALLEKRGRASTREVTAVTMPEGLIGGTETVIFFSLFFLLPKYLLFMYYLMAALTLISAAQRIIWAMRKL